VIAGLKTARERGLLTVALTGNGGGALAALADELIDVPHAATPRIQEVHGMVVHLLCQIIEEEATP
jgi:D-sedoheptulose 7-phosphate isomerase